LKGDVLDNLLLEDVLQGVNDVYHCAAVVSFNPRDKQSMFATNITGTANMINAALSTGVEKFCYVSSVAALGRNTKGEPIDEETRWSADNRNSNYSKSKHFAEVEVWRGIGEGLNCVIVNPSIILGAGDWNRSSAKIFKTAYEEFAWYADGTTGFVDVTDVVTAMRQLMDKEMYADRFILSAGTKTYREVFTEIAGAFGKKPPTKKVTPFLASVVTALESIKSMIAGTEPLLTKETAYEALSPIDYNNEKLTKRLPSFTYTPFKETISRIAAELADKYSLR
jgi:nucleoside-diphosphate-sugar epimerase